ncbi:hypothetical protein [Fischerella sp. JS2]|uniref:hypothetical protein n=1 Tax=Fischerella sp. JS2 TaxID=2597771 RepID=UPI0028EF51D7|nr:hypothetical protein [Fischerella sp. JS2]
MENTQAVQQPLEAKAPVTEAVKSGSQLQTSKNSLLHLLVQHPWLLFVGALLTLLSTTAIAVYSLGYVGRVEREEPEFVQLEAESPITITPQTTKVSKSPISLQMIAAIAMSCASGCFVVFLWLNRPKQQKVQTNPHRRPQLRWRQRRQEAQEPLPTNNLAVFVPPVPQSSQTPPEPEKPIVTVLPPEAEFNKDGKDSLASMMDIRKQTSLSALLRE